MLHCPHDHRNKHFLPRHIVDSSGLDGNEVFIYVINRKFPNKTTRIVVMLKTEFEKSQKRRKRPAIRKIITNVLMKHHLSSRWEKYIQHLNTRASPASSTSQHVSKHRNFRRSQRKRKEFKLKSWKPKHKEKRVSRRRRQDGIGSRRRGVERSTLNSSGNNTSSARLRLLRLFVKIESDGVLSRAVLETTLETVHRQ